MMNHAWGSLVGIPADVLTLPVAHHPLSIGLVTVAVGGMGYGFVRMRIITTVVARPKTLSLE